MCRLISPRERYFSDPEFNKLVDMMVNSIHSCHYTPSELREAAILASIIYQESQPPSLILQDVRISNWLNRAVQESKDETSQTSYY